MACSEIQYHRPVTERVRAIICVPVRCSLGPKPRNPETAMEGLLHCGQARARGDGAPDQAQESTGRVSNSVRTLLPSPLGVTHPPVRSCGILIFAALLHCDAVRCGSGSSTVAGILVYSWACYGKNSQQSRRDQLCYTGSPVDPISTGK